MSTEFITDIGNFDNINFNNTISGKTGVFENSIVIQDQEVATKEYVDNDISSLAVRDTGFYNQITGLLGEDLDFGTDVSSLSAKDTSLESDISSLAVRDTGFYNQITGLLSEDTNIVDDISSLHVVSTGNQTGINDLNIDVSSLHIRDNDTNSYINNKIDEFFEKNTDEASVPTKLFADTGAFNFSLTVGGSPVLTEVTDGEIRWEDAPSTSISPGLSGQVAYDSGYMYVCVTDNNWRRFAISDF